LLSFAIYRADAGIGAAGVEGNMRNCLAAAAALMAAAIATVATADDKLGVVLMHGKEGLPTHLQGLASAMSAAGYLVDRPEMCWSRRRIYDMAYLDCLKDTDKAVEKLRSQGATAVVVAGMSQGGNAALAYGARREGLKGIVALAPAPPVEFVSRRPAIAKSVADAQAMVASGRGDRPATFADLNTRGPFEVSTTAKIYLTFFGPEAPGIMPDNAARLKAPVLIVSGMGDPSQRSVPYGFARAPAHKLNWHVTVAADHRGTPMAARDIVLSWLRLIAAP
jgi:dienelactone hydrolase